MIFFFAKMFFGLKIKKSLVEVDGGGRAW